MTLPRAALDTESLLSHAPYVRSLARELVFDPHLARDVEQEALLAALEHAPRERGALRPWLAVLVRNFAFQAWRSGARREQREHRSARPESAVSTPAEILEREELRRALVERVLALDAPLRDVLIQRFFDELPPRAIARRIELPVETVRTRIKRGLELLREQLDREHRGDRSAWSLALVRALKVPASGAQLAGALVTSLPGVFFMAIFKKATLGAIVLVLVVAGLYLRARLGRAERAETAPGDVAVLASPNEVATLSAPPGGEAGAVDQRTAIAAVPPTAAEAAQAEGSVLLRVSWHDGTPAAGIGAFVETIERSMFEGTLEVQTGPEGTCRIDHLKPGRVRVRLDRHAEGSVEVKVRELAELSLTIEDGNDIVGLVVEADGSPVAGADIYADHGYLMGHVLAHSGPDGRFDIRSISRGMVWLSARAPLHAPTPQVLVGGVGKEGPRTVEMRLVFLARGGALEGVLRDGDGKPVTNAQVLVGDEIDFMKPGELDPIPLPDDSEAYLPSAQRVTADGEGRFRFAGVPAGRQPVGVRAPGFGQWNGEAEVREGELAQMEIVLLPGTTVEGTLSDAAGNPIEKLPIVLAGECAFRHHSANTAADGSFALHDLPAGEFELVVFKDGAPTTVSTHLVGSPGAVLRWDPVLGGGLVIRGRVVARGLDPTRFMIQCTGSANTQGMLRVDTAEPDAGGLFEFPDCADVPHRLEVSSSEQPSFPLAVLEHVLPTGQELVIEIDPALWPSARFKGRVLDAAAGPLADAHVMLKGERAGQSGLLWPTDPTGAFDIGPYPPGRWRIQVWRLGLAKPLLVTDEVQVGAGEIYDFGDLIVE